MKLHPPFQISARLMPGLRIGTAWVQLEYSRRADTSGRTRYHWVVDLDNGESFNAHDLRSGVDGGNLQEGFCSLLAFLYAAGEGMRGTKRGESGRLFPEAVASWAAEYLDEIGLMGLELESAKGRIEE